MKIKVADLEPNPYRKMDKYPINRADIELLKSKIKKTFFWDNILARKKDGKYQLAYGHRRWVALQELGIKEIDIPVKDLPDSEMLIIMADENHQNDPNPAVMTQTISTIKEYLDGELGKYETWEKFRSDARIRPIIDSEPKFRTIKAKGVGRETILKFLGPEWKANTIQIALEIIDNEDIVDRKAVESLPVMRRAREFVRAVKKHKIPKPTQRKLVKKILEEDIGSDYIPDLVAEHSILSVKRDKPKPKSLPMLDDFIKETCGLMATLRKSLNAIKGKLDNIQSPRLRESFVRDGKELTELMKGIFK